jgi:uncharacterized paraquat-inducible protein A
MSSPVVIACPNCDKPLKVPPAVFGKKIKCKLCQHAFVVQDPDAPARPAKGAKPPPKPASPPPPPAKNRFDDDDDDGRQIEVISEGDEVARCPHCAKELDPPDAIVCVNCGFNNVTRAKADTKKVWAPTAMDWMSHLLPGIIALAIVIGLIVFNVISFVRMRDWLEGSFLEMEDKDAAGRKRYFVAPGFFITVIFMVSLVIFVPAAKFAYRRLIKEFRPPETIKK